MQHSFDVNIAKQYGVNSAILLNNIYFWIEKNKANNNNYYDGYYWTYNSKKAFAELFPYLNARQIDYALKKLIEDGILITGNYNKMAYDRTLWYAITKKGYCILQNCEMEETKSLNGNDNNVKPIPDINNNINSNNKTHIQEGYETKFNSIQQVGQTEDNCLPLQCNNEVTNILSFEEVSFETFWASYPKKVNKKGCYKSFKNIKNLKSELPLIMNALDNFKKSKQWVKDNGTYIPNPTTFINQERWKDQVEANERQNVLDNLDMTEWI